MNPKATTARKIINTDARRRTPIKRSPAYITLISETGNRNELRKGNRSERANA